MTRIIGIDPGSRHTGYGIIESERGRAQLIAAGRISTLAGTVPERLLQIRNELSALLRDFAPDEAAVEEVFVNKNVHSALVLGQARGVALCTLAESALSIAEYAPTLAVSAGPTDTAPLRRLEAIPASSSLLPCSCAKSAGYCS